MTTEAGVPNPGSDEAVAIGCTCPVMDNARGKGHMCIPDYYWISGGCPVHNTDTTTRRAEGVGVKTAIYIEDGGGRSVRTIK